MLRSGYWDDPRARATFKGFVHNIHGLDLAEWEAAGCWDDAYTPFSLFLGDEMVASVCIYLLDAVVHGRPARLAQISAVGTLPQWRRRGLNRQLTDTALQWAEGKHGGVFLFASTDAIPFYERCGFTPIEEYVEVADIEPVPGRAGKIKLDSGKAADRERIYHFAECRAPVSHRFGIKSAKLLMFHALYTLRDCAYEIPELDCLVFCRRSDGCLSIFDIVGERIPSLKELYPFVADEKDRQVEFHFHPDKLGVGHTRSTPLKGNHPFVRGPFPVQDPAFPFTSRA